MGGTPLTDIVGVKFKNTGKTYFFDPGDLTPAEGTPVIAETARGLEMGEISMPRRAFDESELVAPLKKIIRIATPEDIETDRKNKEQEDEIFGIALKKIADHKLDMKLIDVECTFDRNKILFYFTSEGRVDFRELVKDLASVFRTRIELRQIGVRDEAKKLGGIGICGCPLCCATFLDEFHPVSIKMAKEQNLSLNPAKISGNCGRLMCCLKYEYESYEQLNREMPPVNSVVETPDGRGIVTEAVLLKGLVKVRLDSSTDQASKTYKSGDVTVISRKPGKAPSEETAEQETET